MCGVKQVLTVLTGLHRGYDRVLKAVGCFYGDTGGGGWNAMSECTTRHFSRGKGTSTQTHTHTHKHKHTHVCFSELAAGWSGEWKCQCQMECLALYSVTHFNPCPLPPNSSSHPQSGRISGLKRIITVGPQCHAETGHIRHHPGCQANTEPAGALHVDATATAALTTHRRRISWETAGHHRGRYAYTDPLP